MVGGPEVPFAVSPDGKRLLLNQTGTDTMQLPLALVTNWTAELKK
jgi:hypothetical protein